MKKFHQLQEDGTVTEYNSKTARDAALKAASRVNDVSTIVLLESDKLYLYEGSRRPLRDSEQNDFTRSRNIHYMPLARKLHYQKVPQAFNLKKADDREQVRDIVQSITHAQ